MRMASALQTDMAESASMMAWTRPAIADSAPGTILTSLNQARKQSPAEALFYLGAMLQAQSRHQEAVAHYRKALEQGLNHAEVHSNLGLALADLGQFDDAVASIRQALSIQPNSIYALHNLGIVLQRMGRLPEARTAYDCALAFQPDHVVILACLGEVLRLMGELEEAETCYRYALILQPDHAGILLNLGMLLQSRMRFDQAEACYRQILDFNPDNADALNNQGALRYAQGHLDEAENLLNRALSASPRHPDAHNNLGILLFARGQMIEAGASYRRALTFRPDFAKAYLHYVQAKKIEPDDRPLMARLKNLSQDSTLDPDQQSDIHFALGKCYDDLGEYGPAFAHFKSGHRLDRHQQVFDPQQHARKVENLIRTCDREFFSHRATWGNPSHLPVFIIGMPRSGTTLVEQIVSSHPQVFGGGELYMLDDQLRRLPFEQIDQFGPQDMNLVANEYLAHLRALSPQAVRITDKMPQNFFHLGLIRLCLPNALIIHCRRNPLDTCLSIYSQKFTSAHPYVHDLHHLAAYYAQYQRLMQHWREVLPGRMLEVQYEDLVRNQDGVTREILEFCNLEWDDRCLEFNRNERIVNTASSWQVRQPMYSSSIGRWQHYRPYIEPLLSLNTH